MITETTKLQRYLTVEFISKRRLNLPAVWLKPEGVTASPEDTIADSISTDLGEWSDQNLGVRLVDGHLELKLTVPDDIWSGCLFEACNFLQVDTRAAYGVHHVSSILINIEDPDTIDRWENRWPKGHTDKQGQKVSTAIRYSSPPTTRSKAIWRVSAPLPGSTIAGHSVVWRPNGKPAATDPILGIEDLEVRPLGATQMESVCRAIAYATLLYWVRIALDGLEEWDDSLTRIIGGWLAKIIPEGQAINAQGKSLEGVCWAPIDSAGSATNLLLFLQQRAHATSQLGVAFLHAERQLERDPNAHVPGWTSLEDALGVQAKIGIRRAFRAGIDISEIERLSERYVLDQSDHQYLDRESLLQGVHYEHSRDELIAQFENEVIFVGKKRHNPFRLYSTSQLRVDVKHREFFPGYEPGSIIRFSPVHGALTNDSDPHPDEYRIFNVFPGFKIKPIATIDQAIMNKAVSMLDRVLSLLTMDNDAQMKWLKQFIAWIAQRPDVKPQVCPIIIGGQGIGKSVFGGNLMRALFDNMAGQADAASLNDNKFLVTPFVGKLITFIDEARLESTSAINVIKKLIRDDYVSGQLKWEHQRSYYVPTRLLIASNQMDIGFSPADAADRAFFFILAWDAKKKKLTATEFLEWTLTLKPFYEEFIACLGNVVFKQHLMRYFTEFEVTRAELEDLKFSSRQDEEVVREFMSPARIMAREIVADARVLPHNDITAWFSRSSVKQAIQRREGSRYTKTSPDQVMDEFESAGVLEHMREGLYRFKYGYYKLLKKMGEAHGMAIINNWPTRPGSEDYEDNTVVSPNGGPLWRGDNPKNRRDSADPRGNYDSDHLDMDD